MKFCVIALLLALVHLSACSTLPDARRINTAAAAHSYVLRGSGTPTVILESGLGDGKESWGPVYDEIAKLTKVFAYDRAGYGASRSTSRSRDGATIVHELRSTLQALNLAPPYVLVGHSVGGTYMELFARTYPEEVAGVVLVDSRHADFTRRCEIAGARSCAPPALIVALMQGAPKWELQSGDKTMRQVLGAGTFPEVPLFVLTSGKMFQSGEKSRDVWLDTQRSLASLTSRSTHTVCDRCGHYVHRDNPELVVSAIQEAVELARRQAATNSR